MLLQFAVAHEENAKARRCTQILVRSRSAHRSSRLCTESNLERAVCSIKKGTSLSLMCAIISDDGTDTDTVHIIVLLAPQITTRSRLPAAKPVQFAI